MTEETSRHGPATNIPPAGSFRKFIISWNDTQHLETPILHRTLADWLEKGLREHRTDQLMMVFRDAGKSTLVGLYCAWRLCHAPDLRILVVAAEQQLATRMTRNIRSILERHPLASHVAVSARSEWAADRFTIARPSTLRDPSVWGRGINGNLTGSRADLIICDDVEVPNTAGTAQARMELRRKLGELRFILVPGGTRLYIGTPHCQDSIYLDPRSIRWRRTASEDRGNTPFLATFDRIEIPVIDECGHSAWPERFPLEILADMQRETGPARFRSQMMLMPEAIEDCRLDPQKLQVYDDEIEVSQVGERIELRLGKRRMQGTCCWWDPSFGRPESGDSSVVACVFTDCEGHYWLHDMAYLTFDETLVDEVDEASQLCRQVVVFARRNEQYSVTVENNGIGQFLPSLLRREATRQGEWLSVNEHRSTRSKSTRILEAFDPLLAAGHLHVHRRVLDSPLIDEMQDWSPTGNRHDDGLDTVSGCLSMQPVRISAIRSGLQRPNWRGATHQLDVRDEFGVF
ncbi:MAG: phage terminase large subunit [Geminicoccaceae bacterium]|nr:phage terminase large subunit [Geminicoccaceae bacterium]